MKPLSLLLTLAVTFFTTPLKPIIDGRVTPIYLDTLSSSLETGLFLFLVKKIIRKGD